MESTTLPTRTLDIEGMTGEPCVQKVTGALKNVHNVSTHTVSVGHATIAADQKGTAEAVTAIDGAGYKAKERNSPEGEAKPGTSKDGQADKNGTKSSATPAGQTSAAPAPAVAKR